MIGDTEEKLIAIAQSSVSLARWKIGQCASDWNKNHSRGRNLYEFSVSIGMTNSDIRECMEIWDQFGDKQEQFISLRWDHFYAARRWSNPFPALDWANTNCATVAEMRAWYRMQQDDKQ